MEKLSNKIKENAREALLKSDKNTTNKFKSRDKDIQDFILDTVYTAQSETIKSAFKNKQAIMLPALGTFKIKETSIIAKKHSKRLLKQYGVSHIKDLNSADRESYISDMEKIMRKEILNRKKFNNE